MRERTLLRTFPELEMETTILEDIKLILTGISDREIKRKKNWKKLLAKDIEILKKENKKEMKRKFWDTQTRTLTQWAKDARRGLRVKFAKGATCEFDDEDRRIIVNSSLSPETKLYYFLHECGHYLTSNSKNYHKKYPLIKFNNKNLSNDEDKIEKETHMLKMIKMKNWLNWDKSSLKKIFKTKNSMNERKLSSLHKKEYCLLRIMEENEAWERGRKLAQTLGLFIDENNFQTRKFHCLNSYLEWAIFDRSPEGGLFF